MGFFGEVIDANGMEIPIPDGHTLKILQACVDPYAIARPATTPSKRTRASIDAPEQQPIVLMANTGGDDRELILCVIDPVNKVYQYSLGHEFGSEDGPVILVVKGGELHVTGQWSWEDDHDCDEECEGSEEECSEDEDVEEEEAPELVELEEVPHTAEKIEEKPKPMPKESKKGNKQKAVVAAEKCSDEEPAPAAKKAKVEAAAGLKPWKVHVENDEGVLSLSPKMVMKAGNVQCTDYIVGKGAEPKAGAAIKVLYEGYFPDGTLFDAKTKRKSPFVFRKGTGQVIKGLDAGLEGMRVGGARELFIPFAMGYGAKGLGMIPGKQDLLFRIRLLA